MRVGKGERTSKACSFQQCEKCGDFLSSPPSLEWMDSSASNARYVKALHDWGDLEGVCSCFVQQTTSTRFVYNL
jgi:hypothetical protein